MEAADPWQDDMKCPVHPRRDVIGYCAECGAVGCDLCVKEVGKRKLCLRCYRKAEREWGQARQRQAVRQRHPKQRLVVRYANGRILKGTSYTIDIESRGFYVDPKDAALDGSQPVFVKFSELKAVFFVRDFDGKYDDKEQHPEWFPEGHEMTVKFKDEEVIEGYALKTYDDDSPRFHLIPKELGNNISVLVERASIAQLALGGPLEQETAAAQEDESERKRLLVSKEETLGDFYFHTKNYFAALSEYDKAFKQSPDSRRLKKKVVVATFNVGVHYVKVKDYRRALEYFEEVLRYEPSNRDATKKADKLRRILATQSKQEAKV